MKRKLPRNILLLLLGILGLGAIGGGAAFIISPDGKLMGMPLSVLNRSPFSSFLFPGIILFLVPLLPRVRSIYQGTHDDQRSTFPQE